jgi:hypothetical protein
MSTFDVIARRVMVESGLSEYGVVPEYIFNSWLMARYREIIDAIPFGQINRKIDTIVITTASISAPGTVALTQGSSAVVGSGTNFVAEMVGKYLRPGLVRGWMRITAVTDTLNLTLDAGFADTTRNESSYFIAQRYYTLDTNIRWITGVRNVSRIFPMSYVAQGILDNLYPDRVASPAVPQWVAPAGLNQTTGRRIIEIYPFADTLYRIEVAGYGNVDEPTLASSPIEDISDQILMEGTLGDAIKFKALKEAEKPQANAQIVQMLHNLARSHENRYYKMLDDLTRRDSVDAPQAKVRLHIQRRDHYGIFDPLTTAEEEVWNRSPKVG